MEYYVYTEKNQKLYVSDEMLERVYLQDEEDYGLEILNAMKEAKNPKYLTVLLKALRHEKLRYRVVATFAILSLKDPSTIPALKNAILALDETDYQNQISIKAITEAALIMLEGGVKQVRQSFFHDATLLSLIKELLSACYSSSRAPFTSEDIEFLVEATSAYCLKALDWIKKLKQDDIEEDIIACFVSFVRASKETDLVYNLDDTFSQSLASSISAVLQSKFSTYCKEIATEAAAGLRKQYALSALNVLTGKLLNRDLKKAYIKAMRIIEGRE